MAGWAWELERAPGERNHGAVEHDGRVAITIMGDVDADDDRTMVVDADDFEAMCRSFLERMAAWQARGA